MELLKLKDYKGIKIKKNKLEVSKDEIKKALEHLQNSRAKTITVNRPAKQGDSIEIDFEVKQGNVKIEGGESKNHPLILGQGKFLPGFEKEMEEMKANEVKEFSLKAPDDWPDKKVAGKALDFKVKMNLVQERDLPKIDDKFAESLGEFKTLKDLEKSIEHGIMQEKGQKEQQRIRMELIEKIADDSKVDIPEKAIDQEVDKMEKEFNFSIQNMGLDMETYLKQIKTDINDLKKTWRIEAEKRIKMTLCLDEIAERENIKVDDQEVEEKVNQDLKQYPNVEEVKKNIDLEQLKEYTKNVLRNQRVFELLEKEAKII